MCKLRRANVLYAGTRQGRTVGDRGKEREERRPTSLLQREKTQEVHAVQDKMNRAAWVVLRVRWSAGPRVTWEKVVVWDTRHPSTWTVATLELQPLPRESATHVSWPRLMSNFCMAMSVQPRDRHVACVWVLAGARLSNKDLVL